MFSGYTYTFKSITKFKNGTLIEDIINLKIIEPCYMAPITIDPISIPGKIFDVSTHNIYEIATLSFSSPTIETGVCEPFVY